MDRSPEAVTFSGPSKVEFLSALNQFRGNAPDAERSAYEFLLKRWGWYSESPDPIPSTQIANDLAAAQAEHTLDPDKRRGVEYAIKGFIAKSFGKKPEDILWTEQVTQQPTVEQGHEAGAQSLP